MPQKLRLADVIAHNRHAIRAVMCSENPRPSMPHADGQVDPGSRAEAWQYRTLMRDQWRTTSGRAGLVRSPSLGVLHNLRDRLMNIFCFFNQRQVWAPAAYLG